jgi:hypothetical protein
MCQLGRLCLVWVTKRYRALTKKRPMTDVRDIGAIGARVLLDRASHAGKTYSFTGALTTFEQFVVVLSQALHRKITPIRDANYFHFLF